MFNIRALGTLSTPSTDLVPFSHLLHLQGKIPMYEIHAKLISFSWYVVVVNSSSCEFHIKKCEIHEKTTCHVKCEIRTKFTWKFSSKFHFYRFYLPCNMCMYINQRILWIYSNLYLRETVSLSCHNIEHCFHQRSV